MQEGKREGKLQQKTNYTHQWDRLEQILTFSFNPWLYILLFENYICFIVWNIFNNLYFVTDR